jgi:NAD(P)H dehydrogenase (quinone)
MEPIRSGVPVTHLRPTLFAQWIMYMAGAIRDKKILPLAFGDARYAPVAGEDLGRVIAAILKDSAQHAGKTYPLYGSREVSQYEIAEMLTRVLGDKITYIPMEIEAFKTLLKELGFTPYFSGIWDTFARIASTESSPEPTTW